MESSLTSLMFLSGIKKYPKNRILLFPGEVPHGAYLIHQGVVKAYSINSAGTEQIADFYTNGDIFPLSWIFDKTTTTLYYYEALTSVSLMQIDKETLRQKIKADRELQSHLVDYAVGQYTTTQLRITALEQARASEKILFTLYYLAHRHSEQETPDIFTLKLSLTHSLLADMVGLTRETTTSELNKLKKQRVIAYSSKSFRINKPKLERLMGEDNFKGLI